MSYSDGVGPAASFYNPLGLALSSNGQLFVSEITFHRIRSVSSSGSTMDANLTVLSYEATSFAAPVIR